MHTKYTSNIIHLNLHFVFMIEVCFKILKYTIHYMKLNTLRVIPLTLCVKLLIAIKIRFP